MNVRSQKNKKAVITTVCVPAETESLHQFCTTRLKTLPIADI